MPSPKITASVVDTNPKTVELTGNNTVLIRYHSNAKATMTAEAQGGASINLDTCIIRNGSETGYGTEHTFEGVASNTFTFSAEDSYGNVGRETVKAQMIDYVKLTCNAANMRPNADGSMTVSCSGDYFNGDFGEHHNALTVFYQYKESNSGAWNGPYSMTVVKTGNSYKATAERSGLDYKKFYDFECVAYDLLMNVGSVSYRVSSLPVFHWGKNDVAFEVPVSVNGDVKLKGGGRTLRFGDSYYISAISQDGLTIGGGKLNLNVDSVTLNGNSVSFAEYGLWTPYLTAAASYSEQMGWYSKSGNVVTVGFRIKATCYSEGEDITIYELPYTPYCAASGGGMCSGAYVSPGFNFQCFAADIDGFITTRVQACNNTTYGSLITSASGCKYPDSSTTLTLSGTITYFTL